MELAVPFEFVMKRHAAEVGAIMRKLRAGTSKEKGRKPEDFTWKYTWAIRGGMTLGWADVLAGRVQPAKVVQPTEDEEVQQLVERTCGVGLQASRGRWWGSETLNGIPPEIIALHRRNVHLARAEKAAWTALPSSEKRRQLQEALGELRKSPGFLELYVEFPEKR